MNMVDIKLLASNCNEIDEDTHRIDRSDWFDSMVKRVAAIRKNIAEMRDFMRGNPKLFCSGGALDDYGTVRAFTKESRVEISKTDWCYKDRNETYFGCSYDTYLRYIENRDFVNIPHEMMRSVTNMIELLERLWTEDIPLTVGEYLKLLRDKAYAMNSDVKKMALVNKATGEKVKRIVISVEM